MKTRIATALSVAGVLFAGSAAALVNTQVLDDHESTPADSVLESPSSVSAATGSAATVPVSIATTVTTRASSTSGATVATVVTIGPASSVPVSAAPVTAASAPSAYAVGESGTVVLDGSTGSLVVVSVTPAPGWIVVSAEPTGPVTARVVFRSDSLEVVFDAALDGGGIVTAVDAQSLAPNPSSVTSGPRTTRGDDDDDHEDDHDVDDDRRGGDDD